MKEQGILEVKWRTNVGMPANLLTKNVTGEQYSNELEALVGHDEFVTAQKEVVFKTRKKDPG